MSNTNMFREFAQARLDHFIAVNSDLPLESEGGLRLQFEVRSSRIEMMILVDEYTRKDHFADFWYQIAEWRRRLQAYQGVFLRRDETGILDGEYAQLELLSKRQENGETYPDLADEVNAELAGLLWWHAKQVETFEGSGSSTSLEAWRLNSGEESYLDVFRQRLRLLNLDNEQEQDAWIKSGLQNLQDGRSVFPPQVPISPARIENALKSWRRTRKRMASS